MARIPKFEPRYLPDILQDSTNYMLVTVPEITDYNRGSIIRSLLEAIASEQAEEYHQMVQISLLMDLDNVRGKDLDSHFSAENTPRLRSLPAIGDIIVSNGNLPSAFLSGTQAAGDTSVVVNSSGPFPTSGYPYNIRIGEGTSFVEDVAVSNNNTSTNTLTTAALVNAHSRSARVSLIEGGALTAAAGTRVRVRSAPDDPSELTATLLETATITAGNYDSNPVLVKMDVSGEVGNIAAGSIRTFVGSPPFDGALVRNESAFSGGTNEESDNNYRSRGRNKRISLARSTVSALHELPVGFEYLDASGITWRIQSATIREHFHSSCDDFVYLYIWPGNFNFIQSTTVTATQTFTASAEDGQAWFRINNYPIVPNTEVIEYSQVGSGTWSTLTKNTDYYINEATGWIEYIGGLNKGDGLRTTGYQYYTDLIQRAQYLVNGLFGNRIEFPGIRAVGVKVLVAPPQALVINDIRAAITVSSGLESEVAPLVENEISRYLAELRIGEDLILAELIERAMSVEKMYNVTFSYPTTDIIVGENQIIDTANVNIVVS